MVSRIKMWSDVSIHGLPLWLLLPWELGELVADRQVTHREAKHSRFTGVISASEIRAHTYRNPWADILRYITTQHHKHQSRGWEVSGSGFGTFSRKIQGQLWCSEIQTENYTKPTHKYIYTIYVCYIYIKLQNKSPRN